MKNAKTKNEEKKQNKSTTIQIVLQFQQYKHCS